MRQILCFVAAVFLISAPAMASDRQKLVRIYSSEWKYRTTEFPEFSTFVGVQGPQNRKWTDLSRDSIEKREARLKSVLKQLQAINRARLSSKDKLSYDLLKYDIESAIDSDRFPGEYLILNQLDGIQNDAPQVIGAMPATKASHYEDIIARLAALPKLIDQTIALLKEGLAKGITPPKITLRDVPAQFDPLLDAAKTPLLTPFSNFPKSISEKDQARLKTEATALYKRDLIPAFEKLRGFLVNTYIPGARQSLGMNALPNGKAWYDERARYYTTTALSAREIHEIGKAEVARIRQEMTKVIAEAGFKGSFEDFTEFLQEDDRFYYEKPEDLLSGYRDITKRVDPQLPKLFGKLPRLTYGVLPIPAHSEKSQPTAYYMPGSLRTGRAGYFYANTYDLRARPKWEMEALAMHEAVPGHHLQIALASEMENVPELQKYIRKSAFVEGWGLYAEGLGYDLGMYKDPYSKFGQLTYEMWRAIRLVVDTGIHALGWSREQAIEYFKKNSSKAEHDIIVEVDRYIAWGGQALAYKMGQLKIKELRERAMKKLGERFEVRAFHDEVLSHGAPPLKVLELKFNEWLSKQSTR